MRNRRRSIVVLLLMVAVINLPILHSTWTQWRIDRGGIDQVAAVTGDFVISPDEDPRYFLEFQYDREFDAAQTLWSVPVDPATYAAAIETDEVRVLVLPDDPGAYKVQGQLSSRVGWVVGLLANLVLLSLAVLIWRTREVGTGHADLHLIAVQDVVRCKPGSSIERVANGTYLVCGDIYAITDDAVVLDLGDRRVHVQLAGHANPVGYQQPAQVTGREGPT